MHTFLLSHGTDETTPFITFSVCLYKHVLRASTRAVEFLVLSFTKQAVVHNCRFTAAHVIGHSVAWNEARHFECSHRPKRNPTSPQDLMLGLHITPELCWLLQACHFKNSSWYCWIPKPCTTLKKATLSCTPPSAPYVKHWNGEKNNSRDGQCSFLAFHVMQNEYYPCLAFPSDQAVPI